MNLAHNNLGGKETYHTSIRAVLLKSYPNSLGYTIFLEMYKSDIYRLCLAFIALILRILPLLRLEGKHCS